MWYNLRNYLRIETASEEHAAKARYDRETHRAAVTQMIVLGRPDLLAMTEMGDEDDLHDLQQRLTEAGLQLPHASRVYAAEGPRHLALLSRWPLLSQASEDDILLDPTQSRQRMRRGILDVTVGIDTGREASALRIVAVHLKSRRPVPQGEAVLRRLEASALRRHIEGIFAADPDTPLLVCGDFNATRDSEELREVMGVRGRDSYLFEIRLEDDRGQRWTYFYPESDSYERIDFMLANKPANRLIDREKSSVLWDMNWFTASDHRPLLVTLKPASLNSP